MNVRSISFLVPIYNEISCLDELIDRITKVINNFKSEFQINVEAIFIDDNSNDGSYNKLIELSKTHSFIKIISLSRNFGHQLAISAGIDNCSSDAAIIIDGDLQDPPEKARDLFLEYIKGYDVVYAKRLTRKGESFFKKFTASIFYNMLNRLTPISIPKNTGDFRIISKRVIDELKKIRESHRFIRGLIPWIGFSSSFIEYNRDKRYGGVTKFSIRKMSNFAINGILSFSSKPIELTIRLALLLIFFGLIGFFYMIYIKLFTYHVVPGITSIVCLILFFSGFNLFFLGIIGSYVSRIYEEVKKRPLYIIREKTNF